MRALGEFGYVDDIRGLFTDGDVACMLSFGLDLSKWTDVRSRRKTIAERLRGVGGTRMPPGAGWPEEDIRKFEDWGADGGPLYRAESYSAYFRELDAHTEYAAAYGNAGDDDWMQHLEGFWSTVIPAWLEYADTPPEPAFLKEAARGRWLQTLQVAATRDAITAMDEKLVGLFKQHFDADAGGVDVHRVIDTFEYFGRDELPFDEDRLQRATNTWPAGNFRLIQDANGVAPAHVHRMDGASMWFRWIAFTASAIEVLGTGDAHHMVRVANTAGLVIGCPFDFIFRGRETSRPEYASDPATEKLLRQKGRFFGTMWDETLREAEELYRFFT